MEALSDKGVPSNEETASELATVRDMLPLRRPQVDGELASENPALEGAC